MLPEKMIHHRADVLLVRGSLLHALSNHAYKAESSLDADQPILDAGTVGGLPFKRSDQCVKNLMLPLGEDKLLLRSITVQLTPGRMVTIARTGLLCTAHQPSPQYNPATYMREVVGDGIDCDVNDYSMEYKNSELNKSSRGRTLQLTEVHGDFVCHSTLNDTPIATGFSNQEKELAKKQRLQCAGAMATLSEIVLNQVQMAREGALPALLEITKVGYHAEISRHISCSFANLSSNPENHLGVFSLQEFRAAFTLAQSAEEFYGCGAAMCLGNLAVTSHNQIQISELGAF
ncbi:hypothetical protein PC121_g18084 [Phytophthora cactorum]|nr:hypothetical protein PC121_g18084 [Phytophthora cactorum]